MFKNELRRSKNTYIILEFLYKAFIFKLLRFALLLMNLQKERLNIFLKANTHEKIICIIPFLLKMPEQSSET